MLKRTSLDRLPARSPAWLAIAAGLFAIPHAAAETYRARDIGGWTLAASADGTGCFLTRQYDGTGQTRLLLGLDTDGINRLSVLNDNWSITPQDRLQLNFRLSRGSYAGHGVIGMMADGKRGFVAGFDAKFLGYFAASPALHIARGDTPVAQLDLTGSGAAVAELRRCVDAHRPGGGAAVRGRKRPDAIPKDPFAPAGRGETP